MPNKIKPKRSYTANSVPLTTDLEVNELAINWADGKAFTKNASGQIVSVTLGGSGGSSSSEDTALRAYFVPTAPTNVTATAGNGQASVTWTASTTIAQIPVTDYVVQFSSNGGTSWTTFSDGTSTSTSAVVTGLTNGTAYTFRVAGVNGVGTGAYSSASAAVTPQATPVPQTITGLQLWLDASDASTLYDATSGGSLVAADGAVARWEDKSGNGRHATQAASANRPARKTAIQAGKDVVRFTNASQHGLNAGTTSDWKFLHDGTPSYAVVVLKPGSSANPNALYAILDTGGVDGFQVGFFLGYDDRTGNGRNDALFCSASAGSASAGTGYQSFTMNDNKLTANTFMVLETLISTGASAANRLLHRINGGSQFGGNTDTQAPSSANSTDVLYIGRTDAGSSLALEGDICEILLYSQQPSTGEQTALRNYLLAKWGIT